MSGPSPGARDHALSPSRHDELLGDITRPWENRESQPAHRALLLGGQPAAGKSTLIDSLLQAQMRHAVVVGMDTLRQFHDCYRPLLYGDTCVVHGMNGDHKLADFYTDHDARIWTDEAVQYLASRHLDILLDGTLGELDSVRDVISNLRHRGYHITVAIVATPQAVSLLANLQRYVKNREGLYGRLCTRRGHDGAYHSVLETVAGIDEDASVDIIGVYDRRGTVIGANELTSSGGWRKKPPNTAKLIKGERARTRDLEEAHDFIDLFRYLRGVLVEEDDEWSEWFDEISKAAASILSVDDYAKLLFP